MELFGPSAWLQGLYLAALKAASEMAKFLGDDEKTSEYTELFDKGYTWTKENLFNGSYFIQKVDVTDKTYTDHFHCHEYWNEEKSQLKYQISEGCALDQMLGQYHANLCGLGDIFDEDQRKTALKSVMRYNFKDSMRELANAWRVFALNDEAGIVICSYPDGAFKPVIPIPYCDECMTGFEYAFAVLLIGEGMVEDGLKIIRAIRDRYDGKKRNPWNEIECGSNYARAMASFALLPTFSGFTFDLPKGFIGFAPLHDGDFKCFWSVGTGWGDVIRRDMSWQLLLYGGSVTLCGIKLSGVGEIDAVYADDVPIRFTQTGDMVAFDFVTINRELRFEIK